MACLLLWHADVTFYVMVGTAGDLTVQQQDRLQNGPNQRIPWVLADIEQCTAFEESTIIPLKSLDSEVLKVTISEVYFIYSHVHLFKFELFAQEINKS